MKRIASTVIALLCLPGVARAQEGRDQLPELVRQVGGAVVSIHVYDRRGSAVGQATGFLLADGRVVTNAHALGGGARVEVFTAADRLLGTATYATALSARVDVAILPRMGQPPGSLVLSEREPAVGERILVIGSPRGFVNTVSDGIVSAYRTVESQRVIQLTAPMSPGSSGSPVVDRDGTVIGMSVGSLPAGQNMNFAIPARDILAVAASPAGRVEFPSSSEPPFAAADRDRDGVGLPTIEVGERLKGRLEPSDMEMEDGSYADGFWLKGAAGARVTIELSSDDFDAYLLVTDTISGSEEILEDDDSSAGSDARIRTSVPYDGTLVIVATSYDPDETGVYTLSVYADPPSLTAEGWESLGRTDEARWFLDPLSVRAGSPGRYRVWVRLSYFDVQVSDEGDEYDEHIVEIELDCDRTRFRVFGGREYLRGELQYTWSDEPSDWSSWGPESTGQALAGAVCPGSGEAGANGGER